VNSKQLSVLWIGVGFIVLMGLIPPWQYQSSNPAGYGLMFSPPPGVHSVDITRLLIQWALVAIVSGALILSLKSAVQGSVGKVPKVAVAVIAVVTGIVGVVYAISEHSKLQAREAGAASAYIESPTQKLIEYSKPKQWETLNFNDGTDVITATLETYWSSNRLHYKLSITGSPKVLAVVPKRFSRLTIELRDGKESLVDQIPVLTEHFSVTRDKSGNITELTQDEEFGFDLSTYKRVAGWDIAWEKL
jgi:hypothetical protein